MTPAACGLTPAATAHYLRAQGHDPNREILAGLLFPKCIDLALVSDLDPLPAALDVYRQLPAMTGPAWWRFYLALQRKDAAIIEADRLRVEDKRAARPARQAARGRTRSSPAAKGKRKAGRR